MIDPIMTIKKTRLVKSQRSVVTTDLIKVENAFKFHFDLYVFNKI